MNGTIKVLCYKSKTLSNGEHPLMLCVCKDNKRKYLSLGISVSAEHWDFRSNLPNDKCPNRERIIILINEKASKSEMSEQEYLRIKKKVETAEGDYKPSGQPSEYTGFRSISLDKIANTAQLIIANLGSTFVPKMNKLLFYADFIHYKKHGYGITGLTYKALPFGPVPEDWGTLYSSLPGIDMEEYVYPSGQSGIRLETIENNENVLSESELSTIEAVCEYFGKMNAGEISQTSHLEKGWIENKDNRSAISYQDAFALNYN